MRLKAAISALVVVASLTPIAESASAALPTQSVLNSPHGEFQPAAGSGALAWERNTRSRPNSFDVYARIGGQNVKVNADTTQAANGGIDDGKLIYQQYDGGQSDIRIFDLTTKTRTIPANLNTSNWEYWPSMFGSRVLFGRLRPNGARRIILFNTLTNIGESIAVTEAKSRFLGPGQVNGDWATWYKCSPETCDVFGYRISTEESFEVPNPGRFQRASSIGPDGTVYFARSGEQCGESVRLMAYRPDGTTERLTQLPDGRDISDTYAMSETAGTSEVFYDNSDCDEAHRSDIFKVIDVSDQELTVTKSGDGSGTVASSPAGIDCGAQCSALFDAGTEVTLTATPDVGSTFLGWSGAGCFGTGTCTVTMDDTQAVNAEFEGPPENFTLAIAKTGSGTGTVTSNPIGINCGTDCTEIYLEDTMVTLTAAPAANSTFTGWIGGGCGTAGTGPCTVTMDASKTVTATFTTANGLTVNKGSSTGDGLVTSTPSGINCGADCSEVYTPGTVVTLTAGAFNGSTFAGWSGAGCTGTGTCQLTMNSAQTVTATFTSNVLTVTKPGTGIGTVTSSDGGINCGVDCSQGYVPNTLVTLTAAPDTNSTFTSWSANCTPTGPLTCDVNMNAAKTVTATFTLKPVLTVNPNGGDGSGTVDSDSPTTDGITGCTSGAPATGDCTQIYEPNADVTLTAVPTGGHDFVEWQNCTTPAGTTCNVTMDAAKTVTAVFNDPTQPVALLTVDPGDGVAGSGTVDSTPAGITGCASGSPTPTGDCTETYTDAPVVTLTATPTATHTVSWTGCDSTPTPETCKVTMTGDKNINALFDDPAMLSAPVQMSVWELLIDAPSAGQVTVVSVRSVRSAMLRGQGWNR